MSAALCWRRQFPGCHRCAGLPQGSAVDAARLVCCGHSEPHIVALHFFILFGVFIEVVDLQTSTMRLAVLAAEAHSFRSTQIEEANR